MRTVKPGDVPWEAREKEYRHQKYLAHKEEVRKVFPNIPYSTARMYYTEWKKTQSKEVAVSFATSYYERNKDKIKQQQQQQKRKEAALNDRSGQKKTYEQGLTTTPGFRSRFLKLELQGFIDSEIRSMFSRHSGDNIYAKKKRG